MRPQLTARQAGSNGSDPGRRAFCRMISAWFYFCLSPTNVVFQKSEARGRLGIDKTRGAWGS